MKYVLALATAALITGCSSTKVSDVSSGDAIPAGTQQAISEQRLSNDFKRQGIRVVYSWSGKLEAIEVTGYAPVWGGSQNAAREAFRVAELEAKILQIEAEARKKAREDGYKIAELEYRLSEAKEALNKPSDS